MKIDLRGGESTKNGVIRSKTIQRTNARIGLNVQIEVEIMQSMYKYVSYGEKKKEILKIKYSQNVTFPEARKKGGTLRIRIT